MNTTHNVYIGYYKEKIIAIAKKKDLIINYLENHRGLTKTQYSIDKKELSDTDILLKYEDYVINEFEGYYIPNIDRDVIEMDSYSLDTELINTIDQLKHIAILSNGVKKIPDEDFENIIKTIQILMKFKSKPKIYNKLNKEFVVSHSILYCNIEEYQKAIRSYKELKEMDTRYRNACIEF